MREQTATETAAPSRQVMPIAPIQVSLWTSFRALLRWSLASIGAMLPLIVVIQAMLAAGIVIGFGFLIPGISQESALFLSSGTPTILLLTIGLVIVPQGISRARASGALEIGRAHV